MGSDATRLTRTLAPARRLTGVAALLLGLMAALLFALPSMAQSKPTFPALTGRVVDQANLLDPATEQALTEKLATLETKSSDQLVVVTVNSLQGYEIEDYGYQLGRAWGIGQKQTNNGALLIIAPNEKKVRVEVGYGLEPILTDAFSTLVIQNDILPSFRSGDYQTGITKGVDAIIAQLSLDPAEAQARAAAIAEEQAKVDVPVGPIIFVVLIFLFIFINGVRAAGRGRRTGRDGFGSILLWAASEALRNSDRTDRGGGWGGGGGGFGGGGGGFGGGGGSFGGGGASGGW